MRNVRGLKACLLRIWLIAALLVNSAGQGYALRPIATKSSDLEPAKEIGDGLDYADIAFDLISKNAQLAKEYSWAEAKKTLIEFLDPLFQKSNAGDFQSFLNRIEIGLRDHLRALKLKDTRLSHVAVQNFEDIKELLSDHNIYKNDTFLDEFHQRHIFIDTNELLAKDDRISIEKMFVRFSKNHPEKLKDPESALMIICENDGAFLSKEHFEEKGNCVKKGQKYWIVYSYPHHKKQRLPVPEADIFRNIRLSLQDVKRIDAMVERLEEALRDKGGEEAYRRLIDQLVAKSGHPPIDLAKVILLYISKKIVEDKPIDMPHYRVPLRKLLLRLMEDEAVEALITQFVIRMYQSGEQKSKGEYSNAFDFLLSLLIEKGRRDIFPIAIHSLMGLSVYNKRRDLIAIDAASVQWELTESLPLFAQAMLLSEDHDIKEALLLKSLDGWGDGYLPLIPVRYAEQRYGEVSDIVFKDIIPYICYLSSSATVSIKDDTWSNISKLLWQFGQATLIEFLDIIANEKSPLARERIFTLLEKAFAENSSTYARIKIHEQWFGKRFGERFIDTLIQLSMEAKTPLRTGVLTERVLDIHPDYRREELAAVLSSLLKDRSRPDISFLLEMLKDIKADDAKDIVISQFLMVDSPFHRQALEYLTALKDPALFEKVWPYITELESSIDNMEHRDICGIGRYFCSVLEPNPDSQLTAKQKERIASFVQRNIWDKEPTDPPWDKYHNEAFMRIWIKLNGLIGTEERLKDTQRLISHINENHDWIPDIVLALIRCPSEKAEPILYDFALRILALEMSGYDLMYKLEKVFEADLTGEQLKRRREFFIRLLRAQLQRRRKFFVQLIDSSVANHLKEKFEKVFELFIFRDTEGALEILNTERWFDVDISDVDLEHRMPPKNKADFETEQFLPEDIRPYFKSWALTHLKDHKRIADLSLLDKKSEVIKRIRELFYNILLNELDMDTGWLGGKGVMDAPQNFLELIFSQEPEYSNKEEKLMSLVMLKPINDIITLKPDISEKDVVASAWDALKTHDPAFYLPLEHRMRKYLNWLYNNDILTAESSLVLDRFCGHFLKGGAGFFMRSKLTSIKKIYKHIDKAGDFYRKNILSFFYPEGVPETLYPEYWGHPGIRNSKLNDFRGVFLRATISLLLKHMGEERHSGLGRAEKAPWSVLEGKKVKAVRSDNVKSAPLRLEGTDVLDSITSSA